MDKLLIKQCLFHGSWLVVPFMTWLEWRLRERRGRWLVAAALLLAGAARCSYAGRRCSGRAPAHPGAGNGADGHPRAGKAGVDQRQIHLSVYKDRAYLQRLVDRINTLRADAVVIAGDFTTSPAASCWSACSPPLETLQKPVYAVLGNHDQQAPGPDIDAELRAALATHGVQVIEGRTVTVRGFGVAGLGDRWVGKDDPGFPCGRSGLWPHLVLAHNPDSAIALDPARVASHWRAGMHGGQDPHSYVPARDSQPVRLRSGEQRSCTRRMAASACTPPWARGDRPADALVQSADHRRAGPAPLASRTMYDARFLPSPGRRVRARLGRPARWAESLREPRLPARAGVTGMPAPRLGMDTAPRDAREGDTLVAAAPGYLKDNSHGEFV